MALGFVRPARPEDAGEIARIQLSTWRTAYRRMFPAHVLANLDEAFLARTWLAAIEQSPSPRHRVLIAVEQGESATEVVGFAAAGPADEQAQAPEEPPPPAAPRGEAGPAPGGPPPAGRGRRRHRPAGRAALGPPRPRQPAALGDRRPVARGRLRVRRGLGLRAGRRDPEIPHLGGLVPRRRRPRTRRRRHARPAAAAARRPERRMIR